MKLAEIWEFNLDPEKLIELSIADLIALENYIGQRGEGETNNFFIISKSIKTKLNQLK